MTMKQFDYGDFKWRLGENIDLMRVVAHEFLAESSAFIQRIDSAIAEGNWEEVASLAHKVKGASSEVSSIYIPTLAKKLELAARAGETAEAKTYFDALKSDVSKLREEMQMKFAS